MKKGSIYFLVGVLIFLILFNVIFFVSGGEESKNAVWVSYAFIHVAYLMVFLTIVFREKSRDVYILNLQLFSIWSIYFIVEFIVGLIFMFSESPTFSFMVQLSIALIYLICFFISKGANVHTLQMEKEQKENQTFLKSISTKVRGLYLTVDNPDLKNKLNLLYDDIKACPTKSCEEAAEVQNDIVTVIDMLINSVNENNIDCAQTLVDRIKKLIIQRNNIVRGK